MTKEFYKSYIGVYIFQCILGLSICYTLYKCFPQHQFYWSMISVVLVIAPNSEESNSLAFDRIKANILGSLIGLLLFLIRIPNLFLICIGVMLTIVIGVLLKLHAALRSALAALVIVMVHEEGKNSTWHIALERVGCVMIGCIIGLLITIVFNSFRISKNKATKIRNKG